VWVMGSGLLHADSLGGGAGTYLGGCFTSFLGFARNSSFAL